MSFFHTLAKTPAFWIVLLTCIVYANTLPNGFTFDDHAIVEDNSAVRSLNIVRIFTTPYWPDREGAGLYRPLTTLSFALNHALHGLEPFGYHLVNLFLHALNALLVYHFARRLMGASPGAWAAALIFALHPVQTEAVNGIVGRAELLSACWVLCAWLLYIRSGVGRGARLNYTYGLALVASSLGMLSKENAACLLGMLIIYDGIFEYRARWPGGLAGFLQRGLPRYLPFILLVGAFLFLRAQVIGSVFLPALPDAAENPLPHLLGAARGLTTLSALGVYLRLLIFPLRLSPDYSYNEIPIVAMPGNLLSWGPLIAMLIAIGLVAFWIKRRSFLIGMMGILIFACAFAPVSNILISIGTIVGERLLYLPMVGASIFLGAIAARLSNSDKARPYVYTGLALLLGLYGARTAMRNSDWRNDVTLFLDAVQNGNQSAKVYYNLGVGYRKQKQFGKALSAFERVAKHKPDDPNSWRYLGIVYAEMGRTDSAIRAYKTALARDSTQIHLWKDLGRLYRESGAESKAREAYEHALDIHADDTEARLALIEICRRQNRTACALRHAQALVDQDPKNREGARLLIALLIETNQRDAAHKRILDARANWPEDPELNAWAKRLQMP